ncbi:MAG: effector binding domain-containing protein [Oscillospiraceae bacterium]|nr:effector binding domain-containing protein [Oscillospiraceae bacterium]
MILLQSEIIETILNYIEDNIIENINVELIAEKSGYSAFHFSRIFSETVGISLIAYITWRKLQFALCDIYKGGKILDTAVKYGFETHGGFTKAFKKYFGSPPSVYILHVSNNSLSTVNIKTLQTKFRKGTLLMTPHIIEFTPFSVVGYPSRHTRENMKNTSDAPTFWNTINLDYGTILTKLYDAFPKSKHCEISMCYDVDEGTGEFTYMLGRGIDNPDDLKNIQPDMKRVDITGGLYAVFSTPPSECSYIKAAQDTWNEIFHNWLPQSEFEYDETRHDFEYHDQRDHGWYFGGKYQIDICVPIRQCEEAKRKWQTEE